MITKNNELFRQVQDYVFIIEFESRVTERDHGLLWIQDELIYQHSPKIDVISFIDSYLTCDSTMLSNQTI